MASSEIPEINPVQANAKLTVNGKTYKLQYDFLALAIFQQATGINPIIEAWGSDPTHILFLLWSGLHAHHPELSVEEVQSWFTSSTALKLYEVTLKAFRGSLPDAELVEVESRENPPLA